MRHLRSPRHSLNRLACLQAKHALCRRRLQAQLELDSRAVTALVAACLKAGFTSVASPNWAYFVQHIDEIIHTGKPGAKL